MSSLNPFLSDLLASGKVEVANEIEPFLDDDLVAATETLQQFYTIDRLNLPLVAPDFEPKPAIWAAQYLYRAIQFTLLRHLDSAAIGKHLVSWSNAPTPAAIYSVDLCFRHLPGLFNFIKGLSPDDVLMIELYKTAAAWPFSSLGIPCEQNDSAESIILSHSALALAYRDRIIAKRDKTRAQRPLIRPYIEAALGNHSDLLWPAWDHQFP